MAISRRFILQASSMPFALMLERCSRGPASGSNTQAAPSTPRFNVLIHGMAVHVMNNPIWVHLPSIPGVNQYPISGKTPLERQRQYRVDLGYQGVPPSNPVPRLSPFEHVVLQRKSDDDLRVNASQAFCSIQLPVPEIVRYFRLIEKQNDDLLAGGRTKSDYNLAPYFIPAVYVFSYTPSGIQPKLVDDTGKPIWQRSGSENLHIYSEPGACETVNRVFSLNSLFDPPLDLNYTQLIAADPPDDSGVPIGIAKEDLLSIYEKSQPGQRCGTGGPSTNHLSVLVYDQPPVDQASPARSA